MSHTAIVLALAQKDRDRELLTEFLEDIGYETRTARGFEEFDRLLTEVTGEQVGLGVFDIDGFTEAVWERSKDLSAEDTSVLILTGNNPERVRKEALSHGADSIVEKPVRKAELESTIHTLLDR
ncbi:MAG: DNA-binding response OmpR family regulator [Halobacteriales archaeon]|jgi:DNA-binding response OmpR family regulator